VVFSLKNLAKIQLTCHLANNQSQSSQMKAPLWDWLRRPIWLAYCDWSAQYCF